jgi:hypothetical protein
MALENTMQVSVEADYVIQDEDVILGRGRSNEQHPGNQYYRSLLQIHEHHYNSTDSRKEKGRIVKRIVNTIVQAGGRFIKVQNNLHVYTEVDISTIHVKTSHALRYQHCRLESTTPDTSNQNLEPHNNTLPSNKRPPSNIPLENTPFIKKRGTDTNNKSRPRCSRSRECAVVLLFPHHLPASSSLSSLTNSATKDNELLSDWEIISALMYEFPAMPITPDTPQPHGSDATVAAWINVDMGWKNDVEMAIELEELLVSDDDSLSSSSLSSCNSVDE